MKTINSILAAILLIISGCVGNRQLDSEFITVDVTKSYPKKELILQDFMEVEYIPLETTDEFVCQGVVMAVGKDIMVVTNSMSINDGDIFIFDRSGKALRKFNHKGQGPGEYVTIYSVVLDEDNGEMFVYDRPSRKMMVYDLNGEFIRSFAHEGSNIHNYRYNFDAKSLICPHSSMGLPVKKHDEPSFVIISKQDGSVIKDVPIDFEEVKQTVSITVQENVPTGFMVKSFPMIPDRTGWILIEPSADTVYRIAPDYSMTPVIARTPSIQTMQPEVFLFPAVLTDRYVFMARAKKEVFSGRPKQTPHTNLMYDREDNSIHEYTIINGDYTVSKPIDMLQIPVNAEIAFQQKIETDVLFEAYEKGELKGKLKEVAASLEEEDNPVIMLVKYKK